MRGISNIEQGNAEGKKLETGDAKKEIRISKSEILNKLELPKYEIQNQPPRHKGTKFLNGITGFFKPRKGTKNTKKIRC